MIEINNIKAGYGGVPIVHDASMQVDQGTIVALLGANGSGKTTLLRAITGAIPIMSGEITFQGASIVGEKSHNLVKRGICMVPEGRHLFGKLSVKDTLYLKRMGRTALDLWYEAVDFSKVQALVIEWTHGNSDYLQGVDFPILLNSTPQETLAYRKLRNRDGGTDSPFTMMVLTLEQKQLEAQAEKAKLILSKDGAVLPYKEYRVLMAGA